MPFGVEVLHLVLVQRVRERLERRLGVRARGLRGGSGAARRGARGLAMSAPTPAREEPRPSTTALARAMEAAARSSSAALRRRSSCSYCARSAIVGRGADDRRVALWRPSASRLVR